MNALALGFIILVLVAALVAALLKDRRPAATAKSEPDWEDGE